jgi:hypothetical protein
MVMRDFQPRGIAIVLAILAVASAVWIGVTWLLRKALGALMPRRRNPFDAER